MGRSLQPRPPASGAGPEYPCSLSGSLPAFHREWTSARAARINQDHSSLHPGRIAPRIPARTKRRIEGSRPSQPRPFNESTAITAFGAGANNAGRLLRNSRICFEALGKFTVFNYPSGRTLIHGLNSCAAHVPRLFGPPHGELWSVRPPVDRYE
jgi:hypothetical protein